MSYAATVHDVLAREYGPLRHGAKLLARHADVSPRTAENWLRRLCAPRGEELIRLMGKCDAIEAEVTRLVAEARAAK